MRRGISGLLALLLGLALGACGGGRDITMEIKMPQDGATVTSPFTLDVVASGIEIASPEAMNGGDAHYVAFVDEEPVLEGETAPSEPDVIHFAFDLLELDLAPGEHTITVILADNDSVRLDDAPVVAVAVTVEEEAESEG